MQNLSIEWSPIDYPAAAIIAQEAAQGLMERLAWMTLKPETIIDIGCGVGETCPLLQSKYPQAKLIALDMALPMLTSVPAQHKVCAQAAFLPLPAQSVDLIFANFLLPWCVSLTAVLKEWQRVLRPDGLLMLSLLGPDTLAGWPQVVPQRIDMHDIGDALLSLFADPVLDVNHIELCYRDTEKMLAELRASGMLAALPIESANDLPQQLNFEVVYAHAFGRKLASASEKEVKIPLAMLKQALVSGDK